mmetsp:Transcript_7150/g.15500  ORF Transcript_7150/g.15500 Transcript_7150/m.15500 type:complete len:260 (-) Transcript_7150:487-1266(-)
MELQPKLLQLHLGLIAALLHLHEVLPKRALRILEPLLYKLHGPGETGHDGHERGLRISHLLDRRLGASEHIHYLLHLYLCSAEFHSHVCHDLLCLNLLVIVLTDAHVWVELLLRLIQSVLKGGVLRERNSTRLRGILLGDLCLLVHLLPGILHGLLSLGDCGFGRREGRRHLLGDGVRNLHAEGTGRQDHRLAGILGLGNCLQGGAKSCLEGLRVPLLLLKQLLVSLGALLLLHRLFLLLPIELLGQLHLLSEARLHAP